MSVIVKGMQMPKPGHCNECDVWSFCWTKKPPYNMFKSTCPLVALPDKHGRLGDLDALIHELNNNHYPGAPYVDAGISIAIGKVCDAPTIVEAEDSE